METAPTASLEMPEAEFLLEFLVIALDAPAQFGESHEFLDRRGSRQRTQEVLGRLDFPFGPLDEQPLLLAGLACLGFPRGAVHPNSLKTPHQTVIMPFTP